MNEKEILIAFLATTLNMATESVSDMLYKKSAEGEPTDEIEDGALDKLKALDQARVTKLKPDTKQFFDNGYKKAQSEVSAAWEKKIKDGFGIEDDVTGEELIAAAKERTGKAKMGDDQVKLHPLYLSLEKAAKAEKEAAIQEAQKQLEDYKASVEKGAMVSKVQARAKEFLMNLKPVLETEQKVANRRIDLFSNEFAQYDYELGEDGEFVPVKDGKRVEDAHGHPVGFDKFVRAIAEENFVFQVQDPKGNAGNGGNGSNGGATGAGRKMTFKNKDEFEAAYFAEQDPAKRTEIANAYQAQTG